MAAKWKMQTEQKEAMALIQVIMKRDLKEGKWLWQQKAKEKKNILEGRMTDYSLSLIHI